MKAYCSWCLEKIKPELVDKSRISRNLYKCPKCGMNIVECRACENFARWDKNVQKDKYGKERIQKQYDQFCLEHRHEIPNFETMKSKISEPSMYEKIYRYNSSNLTKASSIAITSGIGMLLGGPLFFYLGPAIGGAVGVAKAGLSGAVATNYGLALLGFGPLAAGGFGMAGGMAVVSAIGTAIGGATGAYIGSQYMGDIDNFEIKKIRKGKDPAIITINGFLSQKDSNNEKGYQDWENEINKKFKRNSWYHVYWESKRLYDIGSMIASSGTSAVLMEMVRKAALHATKQATKKIGPAASLITTIQLSTNPWHVAIKRAEKTGVLLADILKRTDKKYIIISHSLGCRVAYSALRALATTDERIIDDVHLTGGAVDNNRENWKIAKQAVSGKIYNYYSKNDWVLRVLYKAGTFFQSSPIGYEKIERVKGIRNIEVSRYVKGHMDFKPKAPDYFI
jgi:hypothetical protein